MVLLKPRNFWFNSLLAACFLTIFSFCSSSVSNEEHKQADSAEISSEDSGEIIDTLIQPMPINPDSNEIDTSTKSRPVIQKVSKAESTVKHAQEMPMPAMDYRTKKQMDSLREAKRKLRDGGK